MGITRFLPIYDPNPTTVSSALAIAAMVALALVLFGRVIARIRTEEACRKDYKLALIITTVVLAAVFSVVAYTGTLTLAAIGNMIAVFGGAGMAVLTVLVMVRVLRRPGRLFISRLPFTMVATIALTMYVATVAYAQTIAANSGGSVAGSMWWNMYRGALWVADLLSVIVVPYAVIALIIAAIAAGVRKFRNRTATP